MRRIVPTTVFLLAALAAAFAPSPRAQALADSTSRTPDEPPHSALVLGAYRAAVAARRADDFAAYRARAEQALALEPGHPIFMLHLARAFALAGDTLSAGTWLMRAVATDLQPDLDGDADLASLRGTASLAAARAEMARRGAPAGMAEVVGRIVESDFLPEGIACDPVTGDLFVGSIYKRKIVRLDRAGVVSDFVPAGGDGLPSVVGMKVDADRRLLWACAGRSPQMEGGSPADTTFNALFAFDLTSGRLVSRHVVPDTTRACILNDCCLGLRGEVYASDTVRGTIWVLSPGADRLTPLVGPDVLVGSNGLALSGDGKRLYVAEYALGIAIVDPSSGAVTRLEHPEEISTCYVDGLLWHEGSLIVVQNNRGLDRVARLYLDESGQRVVAMTVLASRLPEFDEPTTAALADGACLFVATSELNRFDATGRLRPLPQRKDYLVMRTPLQ